MENQTLTENQNLTNGQLFSNLTKPMLGTLTEAFDEIDMKATMEVLSSIAYSSKIEIRESISNGHDTDVIDIQLDRIFTVIDAMVFLSATERTLSSYERLQKLNDNE